MKKIGVRILLVDDYEPWRRFVASALQKRPDLKIIGEAADGLAAVMKAEELQPDLILLDISLPSLNGIQAARRIKTVSPASKILFVSENASFEIAQEAVRSGAFGYVVKSQAGSKLLPAIDAVIQGKKFSGPAFANDLFLTGVPEASHRASTGSRQNGKGRCHEVAFYADDASFIEGFAGFVNSAMQANKVVVVLATESHRAGIRELLTAANIDLGAAMKRGSFIEEDVDDLISSIMVNSNLDSIRIESKTTSLLKKAKGAKASGSRVAFCGEIAPTLLASGEVEAAIQVERFFDDVVRAHDVDVLCGYLVPSLPNSHHEQILERICAEHSKCYKA